MQDALNYEGKAVKGSKILILGLCYRPAVDDMRETPATQLIEGLRNLGGELDYHDPYCPEVPPMSEHAEIAGVKSVSLNRVADFDLILIAMNHSAVDYDE